jgi:hypothetical protein
LAIVYISFLSLKELQAGTVRKIYSDGVTMLPINLRMGQTTVLRFVEKPKKVVLGNSNYSTVEFIDNDLAIKPLGTVTTNFFVYGIKNVYGFLLRSNQINSYDDLVEVDLKENKLIQESKQVAKLSSFKEVSRPQIIFFVAKNLKVTILRVQRFEQKEFHLIDLLIENTSVTEVDLSKIEILLTRGKLKLMPQEFILQQRKIKAGGSIKGRIFFSISKRADLSVGIKLNDTKSEQIILGKFL